MGETYEAWDSELKDRVALKTIRQEIASEPAVIERFKEEVRQARGISHPNVCRVYDLFSHEIGPGIGSEEQFLQHISKAERHFWVLEQNDEQTQAH